MSDKLLTRFKQMKKLEVLTLIQLLIAIMILAPSLSSRIVFGDPIVRYPVYIESAHIVSEGAYFRFWIRNGGHDPMYLTVNNDTLYIPSLESIDYNVIAPEVSLPYEKVTYAFKVRFNISDPVSHDIEYMVLVLDSSFLTIFDLAAPIHVIAVMLAIGTTFYFTRRRYLLRKTGNARQKMIAEDYTKEFLDRIIEIELELAEKPDSVCLGSHLQAIGFRSPRF